MGAVKRAVPVAVKHRASTIMKPTTAASPRMVGHPTPSHCLILIRLVRLLLGLQLPAYTLFGECRTYVAHWAGSTYGHSPPGHVPSHCAKTPTHEPIETSIVWQGPALPI